MILVLDYYNFKAEKIISHFNLKNTAYLDPEIISKKCFTAETYIFHKEESQNLSYIRYYFDEIFEIKDNILFYVNKRKNIRKIFEYKDNRFCQIKSVINKDPDTKIVAKENYLPYLKVQENESVEFPDDEEEIEEI